MASAWGIAWHWRRRRGEARLAPLLARLAAACTLAMALAAVQILPVLEFVSESRRVGGEVATDVYRFSLDPFRLVELIWPNVFGTLAPRIAPGSRLSRPRETTSPGSTRSTWEAWRWSWR